MRNCHPISSKKIVHDKNKSTLKEMRFDIFRANPPWTSSKFLCANHYTTTTTTTHGGPTPMDKDGIIELSGKASCLHPVFGPPFTHYPPLSVVSAK
jgi:hypothetical protein